MFSRCTSTSFEYDENNRLIKEYGTYSNTIYNYKDDKLISIKYIGKYDSDGNHEIIYENNKIMNLKSYDLIEPLG